MLTETLEIDKSGRGTWREKRNAEYVGYSVKVEVTHPKGSWIFEPKV